MSIHTQDYRELIDETLTYYDLKPEQLEIVMSVRDWCRERGVTEENPNRSGMCFCPGTAGVCHIVLVAEISSEMVDSANADYS